MIQIPKRTPSTIPYDLLACALLVLFGGCTGIGKSSDRVVVVSGPVGDPVSVRVIFGYDAAQVPAGTAWMLARAFESSYSVTDGAALSGSATTLRANASREVLTLDLTCPKTSFAQATEHLAQLLSQFPIDNSELEDLRLHQLAALNSLRQDANWLAYSVFWATAYHGTDYSLPPIGSDSTIAQINLDDVELFKTKFITKDNYVLGLTGPNAATAVATFDAQLQEALPPGGPAERIPVTIAPSGLGIRIVELPELPESTILVGVGTKHQSSDSASLVLAMATALETSPAMSLTGMDQSLRFERGLVDAIDATTSWIESTNPLVELRADEPTHRDYVAITIQLDPMNALYAARIVIKELEDIHTAGLATDDILRMEQLLSRADSADANPLSLMRIRLARRWMGLDATLASPMSKSNLLTTVRSRQLLRSAYDPAHLWIIAVVPDAERFRSEVLGGMSTYMYPEWVDRNEIRRLDQEYLSFRPFWQAGNTQLFKAGSLFR